MEAFDHAASVSLPQGATTSTAGSAGGSRGLRIDLHVAVMPATRRTPSGTWSMWMRTGMRWASRTQVKIGLTVASPADPAGVGDVDAAGDAVDMAADDLL